MKELRFIPLKDSDLTGEILANYLRKRLPILHGIVDKLVKAGCPLRLTPGGIAFDPPDVTDDTPADVANEKLSSLGITEEVLDSPVRSLAEILEAEEEYGDRVWYDENDRQLRDPDSHVCDCCQEARNERMSEVEATYGRRSLMVSGGSDFERGILQGKLEALEWLLGADWEDPEERHQAERIGKLLTTADAVERIRQLREELAESADDLDEEILTDDEQDRPNGPTASASNGRLGAALGFGSASLHRGGYAR